MPLYKLTQALTHIHTQRNNIESTRVIVSKKDRTLGDYALFFSHVSIHDANREAILKNAYS